MASLQCFIRNWKTKALIGLFICSSSCFFSLNLSRGIYGGSARNSNSFFERADILSLWFWITGVGSNSKFSNIKFMVSETRICMLHENNVRSLAVEIFLKREKMLSGNVLVVAKLFKAAAPKQKSRKQNRKTKRKQVDRWDQNHRLTLWSSTTKTAGNWRISRTQHLLNVTKNLLVLGY